MDAITIQVLRNKITSLIDEMHYHFYRSGYSTIIRESRDFSCVILDRDGRLVAWLTARCTMASASGSFCQLSAATTTSAMG